MLPLFYVRHARNRLRYWKLNRSVVEDALLDPDAVTPSVQGRFNAWKLDNIGWIRVTYVDEIDKRVIITVTVRDKGPD